MALKTELQYEDIFGDHVELLTGLNRDNLVRPMKQTNGARVAQRMGNLLEGLTPSIDWVAYHIKFNEQTEEPYTELDHSKVYAKRFLRVEYNFYGPNAANNALKLEKLIYTQASFDFLIAHGIVFSDVRQNVIDMDQEMNEQWWIRRNLSLSYLESVEIDNPSGALGEVDSTEVLVEKI